MPGGLRARRRSKGHTSIRVIALESLTILDDDQGPSGATAKADTITDQRNVCASLDVAGAPSITAAVCRAMVPTNSAHTQSHKVVEMLLVITGGVVRRTPKADAMIITKAVIPKASNGTPSSARFAPENLRIQVESVTRRMMWT
jgi:hypothetical protein